MKRDTNVLAYSTKAPNTTRYLEHIKKYHLKDRGFGTHVSEGGSAKSYKPGKRLKTMHDYGLTELDTMRKLGADWALRHNVSDRALASFEFQAFAHALLVNNLYLNKLGFAKPLPLTHLRFAQTIQDKTRIKLEIKTQVESNGYFSIVSDGCTKKKHHFTSIGISFIDSSMKMHNYALACTHLLSTGNIVDQISARLDEYDVPASKLLASTTDTASAAMHMSRNMLAKLTFSRRVLVRLLNLF